MEPFLWLLALVVGAFVADRLLLKAGDPPTAGEAGTRAEKVGLP